MKKLIKRNILICSAIIMLFTTACSSKTKNNDDTKTTTTTTAAVTTTSPDSGNDDPEQTPSDITPAMWEITTKNGSTIYLFGSMHALPDSAYPLPKVLTEAYSSSDAIAVECDVVDFQADLSQQIAMTEDLVYSDGSTIKDHVDNNTYKKVVSKLKNWGMYMEAFDYYKPMFFTSIFQDYICKKAELDSTAGIDAYFLQKAKDDSKEIIEVETVQTQLDLLMGFSDEINNMMLESYLAEDAELISELLALYDAWASGDIDKLNELDSADVSQLTKEELKIYNEYNKAMLTDRNKVMADKVIELTKANKNVFYCVGAAHFPGKGGILELLDDAGIEYKAVEYQK